MMRPLLVLSLLVTCSGSYLFGQGVLTNETIISFANVNMPAQIVAQLVRTRPGNYDISPEALISLKQAGVADAVITAIVNREFGNSPVSAPSEAKSMPAGGDIHLPAPMTAVVPSIDSNGLQARSYRSAGMAVPLQLADGTPVSLRLTTATSSANAKLGDPVTFQVLRNVAVHGTLVIPRGARATGTIAVVKRKGDMGRGGALQLSIDAVTLPDGRQVPIRATNGETATGSHSDTIAFKAGTKWIAAPFFVFQGKNAVIPHGTEIVAYVDGDFPITN